MRIAVFSDIHGNLEAFQACLEDAQVFKPDLKVMLGDYINGAPNPKECWDLVCKEGNIILRGNHERYIFDFGTERELPEWRTFWFIPIRWSHARLTAADVASMASLPLVHTIDEAGGLCLMHSSLITDNFAPWPRMTRARFEANFMATPARFLLRGHNHVFRHFRVPDKRLEQVGSIGFPLDGLQKAEYAILESTRTGWRMHRRFIDYDRQSMLKKFKDSGLWDSSYSSKLYYYELKTGKAVFFPFLSEFSGPVNRGEIGIEEAYRLYVERLGLE